ncbi:MAG: GNAT family N-acetyltransferase, partial [Burkholderiaceae bacterium]
MDAKRLDGYRIVVADWATCAADAAAVRHEVFVLEQQVPLEEEMDERDAVCVHAVVYGPEGG